MVAAGPLAPKQKGADVLQWQTPQQGLSLRVTVKDWSRHYEMFPEFQSELALYWFFLLHTLKLNNFHLPCDLGAILLLISSVRL